MTVTITGYGSGNKIGPGLPLQISTDTAIPSNSGFQITIGLGDSGFSPTFVFFQQPAHSNLQVWPWTNVNGITLTGAFNNELDVGGAAHTFVELKNGFGATIDSANATLTYEPALGLGTQAKFIQQNSTAGGLTADQATQLANADSQSAATLAGITASIGTAGSTVSATLGQLFSGALLDALTLTELTSGDTCSRFVAGLVGSPFGLIVRATVIPDFYPFTAPGDTWTPLDLLVVTFIRGSDTLERIGIHTGTRMFYPLPGNLMPIGNDLPINFLPPDYAVQIDPGNGVCFRAYGMNLP